MTKLRKREHIGYDARTRKLRWLLRSKQNGGHNHVLPEPIRVGDSMIILISEPVPNYWARSASEWDRKRIFTPGGTYKRERFPALEKVFAGWATEHN